MKALSKERERRYPFVYILAMDLRCYLLDQPVSAGPPSPVYRVGKFAPAQPGGGRRGVVACLALATATTVSLRFAFEARTEAKRAFELGQIAAAERDRAEHARAAAAAEAKRATEQESDRNRATGQFPESPRCNRRGSQTGY